MAHRNARLTPRTRLELVLAIKEGLSHAEAARQFRVSRATAGKRARRFLHPLSAGGHMVHWAVGPKTSHRAKRLGSNCLSCQG
jgi:predicted RNA polymerase sigma factor